MAVNGGQGFRRGGGDHDGCQVVAPPVSVNVGIIEVIMLDVKCTFLYGSVQRRVYIELPLQDPQAKDKTKLGRLVQAM